MRRLATWRHADFAEAGRLRTTPNGKSGKETGMLEGNDIICFATIGMAIP